MLNTNSGALLLNSYWNHMLQLMFEYVKWNNTLQDDDNNNSRNNSMNIHSMPVAVLSTWHISVNLHNNLIKYALLLSPFGNKKTEGQRDK